MNTKRKMKYGTVDIPEEAFAPANVRRRISIMIPEDVLAKLKELAASEGLPYQTLMNKILHNAINKDSMASRLDHIEGLLARSKPWKDVRKGLLAKRGK